MNLPQELVDEIINNIPPNDRRSLRNCSLVARSWLRPSRKRLFEAIEIHQRSLEPWLHNISPTNLELLWHVRQLSYGGYAQDALQPIHRALCNYFPSLSQLRHLTLIFSYVRSHPREMQLFTAFQHTLSAISLKNCHVTTNASVVFINYFPNLAYLYLHGVDYIQESGPMPPPFSNFLEKAVRFYVPRGDHESPC